MGRLIKHGAHDGCDVALHKNNKHGLCLAHYNAGRAAKSALKAESNWPFRKRCEECRKFLHKNTLGSKCWDCISFARRVPEDRLEDYEVMKNRLRSAKLAFEWIMAGKPVEPVKFRMKCKVTAKEVFRKVAVELQVEEQDIVGGARFRYLVRARATAAVALHRSGMSFAQIGRRMNRDHTTVINLIRRFPAYARMDRRLERVARQVAA